MDVLDTELGVKISKQAWSQTTSKRASSQTKRTSWESNQTWWKVCLGIWNVHFRDPGGLSVLGCIVFTWSLQTASSRPNAGGTTARSNARAIEALQERMSVYATRQVMQKWLLLSYDFDCGRDLCLGVGIRHGNLTSLFRSNPTITLTSMSNNHLMQRIVQNLFWPVNLISGTCFRERSHRHSSVWVGKSTPVPSKRCKTDDFMCIHAM